MQLTHNLQTQSIKQAITMTKHGQGRSSSQRAKDHRAKMKEDPEFLAKERDRSRRSRAKSKVKNPELAAVGMFLKAQEKEQKQFLKLHGCKERTVLAKLFFKVKGSIDDKAKDEEIARPMDEVARLKKRSPESRDEEGGYGYGGEPEEKRYRRDHEYY